MTAAGRCDDGNIYNDDGCNNHCYVESGWVCDGGTPTSRDICTEICGDALNVGEWPCDDGNLASGDGCSSACYIETGFTCTGGTKYTPDTCFETCGDGLNLGFY